MKSRFSFPFLAAFAALCSVGHAQIVFQSPVALTQTPSDILTDGTYVDAVGVNTDGNNHDQTITVGDTAFNFLFSDPGIVFAQPVNIGSDGSGSNATPFKTVLNGVAYIGNFNVNDKSSDTVTLNKLIAGNIYQVQVFSLGGFGVQLTGANSVIAHNQYSVGTFTALSNAQTFTYQDNPGTGIGEINAVALRDITSVPEPSTYVMLSAGLLSAAWFGRRRSRLEF